VGGRFKFFGGDVSLSRSMTCLLWGSLMASFICLLGPGQRLCFQGLAQKSGYEQNTTSVFSVYNMIMN
jgi:hypothetical protein